MFWLCGIGAGVVGRRTTTAPRIASMEEEVFSFEVSVQQCQASASGCNRGICPAIYAVI